MDLCYFSTPLPSFLELPLWHIATRHLRYSHAKYIDIIALIKIWLIENLWYKLEFWLRIDCSSKGAREDKITADNGFNCRTISRFVWCIFTYLCNTLPIRVMHTWHSNANLFILNSANELTLLSGRYSGPLFNEVWYIFFLFSNSLFIWICRSFIFDSDILMLFRICTYIPSVCNFLGLSSLVVSFVVINFYFLSF